MEVSDKLKDNFSDVYQQICGNIISFLYVVDEFDTVHAFNKYAADIFKDRLKIEHKFCLDIKDSDAVKISESIENEKVYFEMYYDKRWFKVMSTDINFNDNKMYKVFSGVDITDMKILTVNLTVDATTDAMTGILNRAVGIEYLEKYTYELQQGGNYFTICFIDLNDLKYVNDYFGHDYGDEYIIKIVNLIKTNVRKTDIFCRMGGDEFLIIFPKCDYSTVNIIMESIKEDIHKLNKEMHHKFKYSISYGIKFFDKSSDLNVQRMLKDVDIAMYDMKNKYKRLISKDKK